MASGAKELRLPVPEAKGEVSALWLRPADARALLVLAHGAGAGMRHPFMEAISDRLADADVATLRYQFPYMEAGRRGPDRPPVLLATVRAAVARAGELAPDLLLLASGKSMGGRMTSLAAAEGRPGQATGSTVGGVRGLVFLGFPLHPAGRPSTGRADHLDRVGLPMLFLQGERDRLCDLALLRPIIERLGQRAALHVVPSADHGFRVLRSSGLNAADVFERLAGAVADWSTTLR